MEDWLSAWRQTATKSAQLLALAESSRNRFWHFRGAPTVFVAYLVAHEAYHWGEVGALLAQQGERLPRELAYGLWDWGDAG